MVEGRRVSYSLSSALNTNTGYVSGAFKCLLSWTVLHRIEITQIIHVSHTTAENLDCQLVDAYEVTLKRN